MPPHAQLHISCDKSLILEQKACEVGWHDVVSQLLNLGALGRTTGDGYFNVSNKDGKRLADFYP